MQTLAASDCLFWRKSVLLAIRKQGRTAFENPNSKTRDTLCSIPNPNMRPTLPFKNATILAPILLNIIAENYVDGQGPAYDLCRMIG